MKLSNRDPAIRAPFRANHDSQQVAEDGAQVVASGEPPPHFGQVAVGVHGKLDAMVRIGDLPVDFGKPRALQELVLDQPGGPLVHAQVSFVVGRRDVGLEFAKQLQREALDRRRQLAGLEHRAATDSAPMPAPATRPVAPPSLRVVRAGLADAAVRPVKAALPPSGLKRRFAVLLVSVEAQELPHRQLRLKLNCLHRPCAFRWWTRPSSAITGSWT